ncbi:DUF4184 family protein [Luedemannella flava]
MPTGGALRLRDYGALDAAHHRWSVTVASAWLGAVSHRLWDIVTHAAIDRGDVRVEALSTEAFAGQPWWRVLFYTSTLFGGAVVVATAVHIGRHGLIRRWHGCSWAPRWSASDKERPSVRACRRRSRRSWPRRGSRGSRRRAGRGGRASTGARCRGGRGAWAASRPSG